MTTPNWQPDTPSLIHGALAYLRILSAKESGAEAHLDEWNAVYGTAELEVDPSVINQGMTTGNLVAAIAAYTEAVGKGLAKAMSTRAAAHGQLELHLVKLLSTATGQPADTILDELDAWATQLED